LTWFGPRGRQRCPSSKTARTTSTTYPSIPNPVGRQSYNKAVQTHSQIEPQAVVIAPTCCTFPGHVTHRGQTSNDKAIAPRIPSKADRKTPVPHSRTLYRQRYRIEMAMMNMAEQRLGMNVAGSRDVVGSIVRCGGTGPKSVAEP
jgi:hypothetical protein